MKAPEGIALHPAHVSDAHNAEATWRGYRSLITIGGLFLHEKSELGVSNGVSDDFPRTPASVFELAAFSVPMACK